MCCQAASVHLGVLHLVGTIRGAKGADALWEDGMFSFKGKHKLLHVVDWEPGCISATEGYLSPVRLFYTKSGATCREPGIAGGSRHRSRSTRRRNRRLRTVCTCTSCFTRRWHSGRTTAPRYETGEATNCWWSVRVEMVDLLVCCPTFIFVFFSCQEKSRAAGLSSGWPVLHEMGSRKMETGESVVFDHNMSWASFLWAQGLKKKRQEEICLGLETCIFFKKQFCEHLW